MLSLNKKTLLTYKSPGWNAELSIQWIIKWCGCSFAYQSNLHIGWMLLNHLKSWTPTIWSTMSVLMFWDPVRKLLSADWLEPTRWYYQALEYLQRNGQQCCPKHLGGKSSTNIRTGLIRVTNLCKISFELRQLHIRLISDTLTQLPKMCFSEGNINFAQVA